MISLSVLFINFNFFYPEDIGGIKLQNFTKICKRIEGGQRAPRKILLYALLLDSQCLCNFRLGFSARRNLFLRYHFNPFYLVALNSRGYSISSNSSADTWKIKHNFLMSSTPGSDSPCSQLATPVGDLCKRKASSFCVKPFSFLNSLILQPISCFIVLFYY